MLRWALLAAALSGFVAVVLGAFGAHALADRLDADAREIYRTASQYHFVHTLALFGGALLPAVRRGCGRWAAGACIAWLAGIVVFSGSLYLLALTGSGWLGAITPLGGAAFLAGWALLAIAGWRD